jgi:CxxC motif-containing protein
MSPKPLRAGGEVDSYCTKCRLVLNHRIIAMVGPTPKKVECSTCGSHHLFRPNVPGDRPEGEARTKSGISEPRSVRQSHVTRAEAARQDREKSWEKATIGKPLNDFKSYRVSATFKEGDLVRHSKFGEGVVTRIVDTGKVEILFRDETRMLAQGMTA